MSLDDISSDFILSKRAEANKPPLYVFSDINIPESMYSQFSLGDLLGERIFQHRKIENPANYNPEVESPNPEYFKVIIFESGNFLIFEEQGWDDGTTLHSYFYDGKSVRYSDMLFSDR